MQNGYSVARFTAPMQWQTNFKRGLNNFANCELIGQGTFASVYRAYSIAERKVVALKVINLPDDETGRESTKREVGLFKSLQHENVVRCLDAFQDYSHNRVSALVLVLEYVSGGDLERYILKRTKPLLNLIPESNIWSIFEQIAAAVAYIHTKKILHRDLKPANILLTENMQVKLTDFGLSRLQNQRSGARTICGTPYYMSPERITEKVYSYGSDVWAMGCILFEMATLSPPFVGEQGNLIALVQKISAADYPPVPEDCYSQQLLTVLDSCLCADERKRPSSADVHKAARMMLEFWQTNQ